MPRYQWLTAGCARLVRSGADAAAATRVDDASFHGLQQSSSVVIRVSLVREGVYPFTAVFRGGQRGDHLTFEFHLLFQTIAERRQEQFLDTRIGFRGASLDFASN